MTDYKSPRSADEQCSLKDLQASQMSPRKTEASSGVGKPPKPK